MPHYKTQAGMTLIEILLALAIAGMLLSFASSGYQNLTANQRIVAASNNLVSAMIVARSEAVKQKRHVTICASSNASTCLTTLTEWNTGWIIFANTSSTTLTRDTVTEPLIQAYGSPKGIDNITLSAASGTVKLLSFRPSGVIGNIASSEERLFTICDSRGTSEARAVLMSRSGRAKTSASGFASVALTCP